MKTIADVLRDKPMSAATAGYLVHCDDQTDALLDEFVSGMTPDEYTALALALQSPSVMRVLSDGRLAFVGAIALRELTRSFARVGRQVRENG